MGGNSIQASATTVRLERLETEARKRWKEAIEEAQAIASEVFGTKNRGELAARTNDLALFLGELDQDGRDLEALVFLRPIWNATIEVPLRQTPAMLRSLLNSA